MKSFRAFNRSGLKEIDLRAELKKTFFGSTEEVPKGALFVLRRMRRIEENKYPTSSEDLITCDCKANSLEQEPDVEYPCDICKGEGYVFDDEIVVGYKTNRYEYQDIEKYMGHGKNTIAMSFFYVEYHKSISRYDKIIEPLIDLEGCLVTPLQELQAHNIHMAERFRSDNGRSEYWRCSCFSV